MGRYGLDWSKGLKNFTDEDWNIVLTETTKIIDAKQNMKEVALSLNDRGIVYQKKKEFDKAILDYNYSIQLIPEFAHAIYNRGKVYWSLKQYDLALSDFNEALRLFPTIQGTPEDIEDTKTCIKMIMAEKEKLSANINMPS
jgi:tetratricopeptide (TPR) repeat protein